jgi:two-component system, NtrC family, sensor kinase
LREIQRLGGFRTHLGLPLLRQDSVIGVLLVSRSIVEPFDDKHIELLSTFAAQAVIAIENARLLNELRQRTDDLSQRTTDLTEALEQQTATSEVLRVISSSPSDLDPVFETMLMNATRLCEAKFGILTLYEGDAGFRVVAMHNAPPALAEQWQGKPVLNPGPQTASARVAATKEVIHISDYAEEAAYKLRDPGAVSVAELGGARTFLAVPMLKENELVGIIHIYRQEIRPFTDKQIALVQNFAAQAVIAILERAAAQRTSTIARTADCHCRRPQSHQQFTRRT